MIPDRADTPGVEILTPADAQQRLTVALDGREWRGRHQDARTPHAAPDSQTAALSVLRGDRGDQR